MLIRLTKLSFFPRGSFDFRSKLGLYLTTSILYFKQVNEEQDRADILKREISMKKVRTAGLLTFLFLLGVFALTFVLVRNQAFASASISVSSYNGNLATITNTISPRVKIVNRGTTTVHLADLKVRYYYTEDGKQAQNFWCTWSNKGASTVTGTFVALKPPVSGADNYVEIGFKAAAGDLPPGGEVEVHVALAKADWSSYNQSNDYSFNKTASTYVAWSKVPTYISGKSGWGAVPGGLSSATPTATSTQPAVVLTPRTTMTSQPVTTPSGVTATSQPTGPVPTTPPIISTPSTNGTDRYFPVGTPVSAMKLAAQNMTKQQVKILIEKQVDANWSVLQSKLGFTTKQEAYAFFLGFATRESTLQAALETGSGPSHSYGPLQAAEPAYSNTKNYASENDVTEMVQYELTDQNFYDPGIAVHSGIRHFLHFVNQAKAAGYSGPELLRHALIGYNTGAINGASADWIKQYSDEIGALAGWYLSTGHLTDAVFTWTGSPAVDRSNPWGWY
jgi:hypothetical protein